uniref:C2H2-type domain-containing protein n=1 Tax=Sphaeramia orbicularis TaxID=375764 RepID=A0A673B314_9TELE
MPWQTDGDQTIKDYLPKCGNNISDFATDGLSSAGSFPYAADLEGLKQDCGMLPTSFLEDYSDVSSCSDADVGESRPSCKFMSSASVVKSTTGSLHQSAMIVKLENCSGNVDDDAGESFEEIDTASNKESGLDVLYSKPLSDDDSSSEMNETILDQTTFNCDGIKHSEGHGAHLKSSMQLLKQFHPVVILKTSQPANEVSQSYCCADCQHTTQNVDDVIEHHHSHHSVHSFQFCKTCNVYLMNEGAEKHLCGVTDEGLQLSSDRVQMKGKRLGRHRCVKCNLIFSKLLHYVKHMRTHTGKTPYRCGGCGEYFSQNESLKKHEYSHRGEKPYKCLECGKGFKRHSYLMSHKITHQRRIQCTVCRKI